jgi:hypothetical protein
VKKVAARKAVRKALVQAVLPVVEALAPTLVAPAPTEGQGE